MDRCRLKTPLLEIDPLQMFDSFENFKPVQDYKQKHRRLFEYGRGLQIPSEIFANIITLDYFARSVSQLEGPGKVDLKKSIHDDKDTCLEDGIDPEYFSVVVWRTKEFLRNTEIQIPQRPLKKIYDQIRQNPAWYLRKELVNECVERGDCCGRICGCCEKRCLTSKEKKGIGHCTVAAKTPPIL